MSSFDLNAAVDEAAGKKKPPFAFHWGEGDDREDFVVEVDGDIRWALALDGKDLRGALVRMLGEDGFRRLDAVDKPFRPEHLQALIKAFVDHAGDSAGKALPRSKRSKTTAVR